MEEAAKKPKGKSRAGLFRTFFVVVLAILCMGYFLWRQFYQPVNPNVIVASGTIEADEAVISPKVAGKLSHLFVDEGYDVKKGELLARLDDAELKAQLQEARADLASAQAKLDEAVNGNRPEQIAEAQAQLAAARSAYAGSKNNAHTAKTNLKRVTDLRLQLDAAKSKLAASDAAYKQAVENLRLVRAGTRPDQILEAKAALDQAIVVLGHAQTYNAREKYLAETGAIAMQVYDDAKASRDEAQRAVDQAKSHLADLMAGPRPQEIRVAEMQALQAKADLDGARASLADAQESYQDRLSARTQNDTASSGADVAHAQVDAAKQQFDLMEAGSRIEDIESARAMRDQAAKAVVYAEEVVGDAKLYAPTDAVVKTKSALPGEELNPGSPVVTLADLDHIWIRVYVPEDQYGKLSLGAPVDVHVDSFPKEVFKGSILSIASDAEFTPKNAQTPEERVKLVFGVKIRVENPDRRLKPGMPGDATIHIK